MPSDTLLFAATETPRIELGSYNLTLPMSSLAIGVDNIHHDVFLSPRFLHLSRDYLFDLIRQNASKTYLPGIELRTAKALDGTAFRKLLADVLHSALTNAKYHKNIEMDLLFRVALLKFLTTELNSQFANLIQEGKEWIRQRGEHFERSQQAHVIKARLSELQSARRSVIRAVGQQVAQSWIDVEENIIAKARKALFGEEFAPLYDLLKNRLIFLEGGKDDAYFLEHYVLLGNYARDPDRFEAMDALFQEFLNHAGVVVSKDPAFQEAEKANTDVIQEAQVMRDEIARLEEQKEAIRKRLDRSDSFLNRFRAPADPADLKASLNDIELRLKHQQVKLEEFGPQLESARQKLDYFHKDYKGKLGDYLNDPENAKRLFDPAGEPEGTRAERTGLLTQLLERLEQQDVLYHVIASYEIRAIAATYHPPVHLQQLRKALVSKDELKRVEQVLKQVPAKRLSEKPIEELSKKIRRYSRDEMMGLVLRFATDFLRLHRDLRDAEHLSACMDRVNLVETEQARDLSRMNNKLYECVLPEEAKTKEDPVISHVIIKADVRGSTKMTQDLLARGLSPASHFSLNLHEPVRKLLDRYGAKKVFIEGDAIILAIFETDSSRTYARSVAKACVLARQILNVCNSYNDGTSKTNLPALELGVGVAHQGEAPTYWTDGESRVMISKALNLSDRLSGCAKLARRMLDRQKSHFGLFQFLQTMAGASAEELDEFLVRYNRNGIELNEEGFLKLYDEISLECIETKLDLPWGKETVTLYYGEVPMGESVELLVLRKGLARELSPEGKIGEPSTHVYYEVCTAPKLYELVAALLRTKHAATETVRA
jgi:class 3 adenylate cyclase